MNVFIIPSWYPSASNPLNGVFVRDQLMAMSGMYNDMNFGVSVWGQNNEEFLLPVHRPISNLRKVLKKHSAAKNRLSPNLVEYFSPAYSFSDKFWKGNIDKTIEANYDNYKTFRSDFGKPDLIHAHVCYKAGYIAQQISRKEGIPYLITEHFGPFPQKYHTTSTHKLKPHIKAALEGANAVVSVSKDLKTRISKCIDYPNIKVLPNFIEPVNRKVANNDKNRTFKFVTVTGLVKGKGLPEMLEGIKLSLEKDHDLRFTIVGGGPLMNELKNQSHQLEIEDYITWTGMVPKGQVSQYLVESDVHLLTSHYESFGVVYIEAMACGIPSIATANGGPVDIINESTGVLIDEVAPEKIAEKILWMKQHYNQFDAGEISNSFRARYSTEAIAPRLRSLYESLI